MVDGRLICTKFIQIDKSATISELIGRFIKNKEHSAIVFDGKNYAGVSDWDLLIKTKLNPQQMKVARIIKKVPVLTGKEDVKEIARLLYTAGTHILPVIIKKKLVGVVKTNDIVNELKLTDYGNNKAEDIMISDPMTIKENDRMGKAIEIMKESRINRLPVVDERGNLSAIASFSDILSNFILGLQAKSDTKGRGTMTQRGPRTIRAFKDKDDLDAYPIKNLASLDIISASKNDKISNIISLMVKKSISSIVIVENKRPIGIITQRDLLKLFLKEQMTF